MASIVEIVPGGNQLFQVTLEGPDGSSQHEVTVPDGLVEDLLGDEAADHSLRDVVWAAMQWQLEQEHRQDVPSTLSLQELRGVGDFDQRVPALVRDRTSTVAPTHQQHQDGRTGTDSDDRLVQEVRDEQDTGEASSPRETL